MHRRPSILSIARRASLSAVAAAAVSGAPALAQQPSPPLTFKAEISLFWGGFRIYSGDIVTKIIQFAIPAGIV